MEQVADEAGVALKTVYVAFATKSGLLRALWDLRLKGDQEETGVAERSWYRAVVEEPDPARRELRARLEEAVRPYRSPAGLDFPGVSLLAAAQRT